MLIVKKYKKLIKNIFLFIPLIVIILISLYFYNIYKSKYLIGTIIYKDTNYFEVITENDSIYRFNYNSDFDIGENIRIKYNKQLNDFNYIQKVDIKSIDEEKIKLNYDNQALKILQDMTLNEKIGQLLLVRIPETNKIETINKYNIGGYILFQRDVDNKRKDELIDEIKLYQSVSSIPLLIAIDEEGGTVSRLSSNKNIVKSPFQSPQELFKSGGFEAIKQDAIIKTNLLEELDINVNLAPVADISTNSKSYIYERSFGKDKNETAKYIETILSTQNNNVSYVLKHFPGYSDNLDTHKSTAIDNRSYKTIKTNDFIPFKVGIKNGANAILVSHNIVSSIDNKPSSLSKNIHNILRNELSFNGIIITDDLSMNAVKGYNTKTPYIDSILAGNNILIVSDYVSAFDEIYNAIIEDKISEELINRLVLKTIQFKINLNLYKQKRA